MISFEDIYFLGEVSSKNQEEQREPPNSGSSYESLETPRTFEGDQDFYMCPSPMEFKWPIIYLEEEESDADNNAVPVGPKVIRMLGAVGKDREIYFMAKDVGSNLKYLDAYGFAKRHATKNIFKVIPEYFTNFMTKGKKLAFNFEDMANKICETTHHHMLPLELVAEMRQLWYNGYVDNTFPEILPFAPRVAFPLVIRKEGPILLKTWLNHYIEETLRHFEYERQILVAPPSVESNYSAAMDDDTTENELQDYPLTISEDNFESVANVKKEDGSFFVPLIPKIEDSLAETTMEERENFMGQNIPAANSVENNPTFSMVIRAEGMWTFKSSNVFQDVISTVKRKSEELEKDYTEQDKVYELHVSLQRKEKIAKTLDN